jgi:hypothetical protein
MNMGNAGTPVRSFWIATIVLLFALAGITACEDLLTDQPGDPRDKLVDTWKVEETPGAVKKSELEVYWVEISKDPNDSTRIMIDNFYNVQAVAGAILNGNTLTLPAQTLEGGYDVTGTGQLQGTRPNEIIWTYRVDDGSGLAQNITAVYTRLTF